MLFEHRLTFAKILWLVALVLIILGSGASVISFFSLQLLIVTLISEALVRHVPSGIRHAMNANCMRLDGSISEKRIRIEASHLKKQRSNVITVLIAIFAVSSIAFWLVPSEASRLLFETKKTSLSSSEVEYDTLSAMKDLVITKLDPSIKPKHSKTSRKKSAFVLTFFVIWTTAAFLVFQSAYLWMLKRLFNSVNQRAQNYRIRDKGRMMKASEAQFGSN